MNANIWATRNFFQFLVRQDHIKQNPLQDIPLIQKNTIVPFIFSPEQTNQLLAAICKRIRKTKYHFLKDLAFYVVILLLARCGMRISEPLRLMRHHFSRDDRTLYIEKTKFSKDRLIPIPKEVVSEIENYLSVRKSIFPHDDSPFLLVRTDQKPPTGQQIRYQFHKAMKRVGLEQPRRVIGNVNFLQPSPHSLHHSFAVYTLLKIRERGENPQHALPILATYMGHSEHLTSDLIIAFLEDLQKKRKNLVKTRNHRLAALKSFAKMLRFKYPEQREVADTILNIPQKRAHKPLVGFLYQDEILEVFQTVDLKTKEGFRDYALLHLLYDSAARATEMATLNLDYFDSLNKTMAILGKGNRFRIIQLKPKTCQLLQLYIRKYRIPPQLPYQDLLFINQRGEALTRHGIYRICKKYLEKALSPKRLKNINPVHSFRHSRAVNMLYSGHPITDIKNHLGHENIQSTMIYLDLNRRRHIQNRFVRYMQSVLTDDSKIGELLQWENEGDLMVWLDSL